MERVENILRRLKMSKTDFCVFIGRFQPVHTAHLKIIEEALSEANELVIVVGSYRAPRSLKNPWTYDERVDMISKAIEENNPKWLKRIHFVRARDYLYNILNWLTGVQNAVSQVVGEGSVKMIGHFKDDSSFYLKLFPQWQLQSQPNFYGANSTDVRDAMFEEGEFTSVVDIIPAGILDTLIEFRDSEVCQDMAREYEYLKNYKKQWESAPFPPTFVTTDAVVVQAGHVLLIKRGRNPGKGRYALPGGFISQGESIQDSCLRELKEETGIVFPKEELKLSLRETNIFDHPYRDQRGRTITHAFYYHIDRLGPLPQVKGGDDASHAMWVPINDLGMMEEEFFSDHLHIINYFIHNTARGR
jgi:bifunctional NMN adenylyltransferase/nudix hydrolase